MRLNWKRGLMGIVAGVCCLATVAEVDAGIIFRRRPSLTPGRGNYQTTTTRTNAPAVAATTAPATTAPYTAVAPASGSTGGAPAAATTTTTQGRRRGVLGRRRSSTVTRTQVTATPSTPMTVRGQTPEGPATQPAPTTAR